MEPQITKSQKLINHSYIADNSKLLSYLKLLEDKRIATIALDIEADNNLHAYGQKLCLVQVFDGSNAILIDPLKVSPGPLKSLFENRDILKVMYGAASDLALLKNTLNVELKSVMDLNAAVVLLHFEKQDLHSVIGSELGILLNGKNKYQTHNWMLRPISQPAIEYAVNDVIHLLKLKDSLIAKLYENGLLDSFFLRNLKIQNKDYTKKPGIRYGRFEGYLELQDNEKALAQRIIDTVDKYAASHDMPFDSVLHKTDVVEIVKDPAYLVKIKFPRRLSESSILGMTSELQSILQDQKVGFSRNTSINHR